MANFSSKNEGSWFYFDGDEKLGGVCIREMPIEKSQEIEKLTTTITKKFKRGQWVEDKKVDTLRASKLTWDYVIVDWKKVHLDGTTMECNKENKYKMMMKSVTFAKHVLESGEELSDMNQEFEEARVKNLKPSSGGTSPELDVKNVK